MGDNIVSISTLKYVNSVDHVLEIFKDLMDECKDVAEMQTVEDTIPIYWMKLLHDEINRLRHHKGT
jgi:hypothetical protein